MNDVKVLICGRDETVSLQYNQLAKIPEAQGVRLTCRQGVVWVTQWGDRRDLVLLPGDSLVPERRGAAILIALESSAVRVQAARTKPAWIRRTLAWVGERYAASAQAAAAR